MPTYSHAVFAEGPMHCCIVYPHSGDDTCAFCSANEWSHRLPAAGAADAQVPRQLAGRVPLDVWLRLVGECYAASELDSLYYKYVFGLLLFIGVLLLLVLAPTAGMVYGGPVALGVFAIMFVCYGALAAHLNKSLEAIVHRNRPTFEQLGCTLNWRQVWIGGVEALSRHVWIEICVLSDGAQLEQHELTSLNFAPAAQRGGHANPTALAAANVMLREPHDQGGPIRNCHDHGVVQPEPLQRALGTDVVREF